MQESTAIDESLVAVWKVGGANYKALYEDALQDAQQLMEGYTGWRFFVVYCSPHEYTSEEGVISGSVVTWQGQAIIKWMTEQEIEEFQKADELMNQFNSL